MRKKKQTEWALARTGGSALRVILDGLLLLAELGGTMLAIVSAYRVETDLVLLAVSCLLATLLYLFSYSVKRYGYVSLFLTLVILGVAAWAVQDRLLGGASLVLDDALRALSDAFPVVPQEFVQVAVAQRAGAVSLFLTVLAFLLGSFMGWAVIRARSALLAAVQSLVWFLPALLADVMPAWPVLMVLLGCWLVLLLSSLTARHDPSGGARFTLLCIPAAALLLAAITLLLPREDYKRPDWGDAVQRKLERAAMSVMQEDAVASLLGVSTVDRTIHLDEAGPREPAGNTVMTVTSDAPGRMYLRGVTAAQYTGSAWEPVPEGACRRIGLEEGKLDGLSPLLFPSMSAAGQRFAEVNIRYETLSGFMYAPYQLSTAPEEVTGVEYREDACLVRSFGVREKNLYFRPNALPDTAQPLTGEAARAEAAYREFVHEQYLGVPVETSRELLRWLDERAAVLTRDPAFLEQLGQLLQREYAASCANSLYEADILALLLEFSADYDQDAPYTPAGEDFAAWFLNESRRGYCVHFATAGALLLRMHGIPARYVEGYTVSVPSSGAVKVRDSDAHAWVEVYLDGYGWYPVDMTPPEGTGIEPHSALREEEKEPPEEPSAPAAPQLPQEQRPEAPPAQTEKPPVREEPESGPWYWLLLVLPALAALPLQAVARRRLYQRKTRSPHTNDAVIAVYGYLERLSARGGEISQEALELAQKARFSPHTLAEEERQTMLRFAEAQRKRVLESLSAGKRLLFFFSGL